MSSDKKSNTLGDARSEKVNTKPLNSAEIEKLMEAVMPEVKKEIEKILHTDKTFLVSIFGLFAAMMTFLTIELQFLKILNSIHHVVGFTLLLFSLLLGFNIALENIMSNSLGKQNTVINYWYNAFLIITFSLGVLFLITQDHKINHSFFASKYTI